MFKKGDRVVVLRDGAGGYDFVEAGDMATVSQVVDNGPEHIVIGLSFYRHPSPLTLMRRKKDGISELLAEAIKNRGANHWFFTPREQKDLQKVEDE